METTMRKSTVKEKNNDRDTLDTLMDKVLDDIQEVRDLVGAENIDVVLRVGNNRSPSYREVKIPSLAMEIKAKV